MQAIQLYEVRVPMLPCDSRYILPCNTVAVTCEVGLPHALSQDESLMSTSLDHLTPTTLPWQSHRAQRGHVHSFTASQPHRSSARMRWRHSRIRVVMYWMLCIEARVWKRGSRIRQRWCR